MILLFKILNLSTFLKLIQLINIRMYQSYIHLILYKSIFIKENILNHYFVLSQELSFNF